MDEIKGFKYKITVKVLLSKQTNKQNWRHRAPVYFNSATTTVINSEYDLDKPFQEILYRIDNWINEGSGWIIESIVGACLNIFIYSLLSASSCIKLPDKLRNASKGLINIKNNEINVFFGVILDIYIH